MANTCPVCGGKLGLLNREKSADGLIHRENHKLCLWEKRAVALKR